MREAQAGQSASVAQLGKLLKEEDGTVSTGDDGGGFVVLPVGRVPPAAVTAAGKAGASISSITHQAEKSFLPPPSPGPELLLPDSREGSQADEYPNFESIGSHQLDPDLKGKKGNGQSEQDLARESQPSETPAMSGIEGKDESFYCMAGFVISELFSDLWVMMLLKSCLLPHTLAEAAARELNEVSERMRDFFRRNPSPADIAGPDSQGPLDDAGREQVARGGREQDESLHVVSGGSTYIMLLIARVFVG